MITVITRSNTDKIVNDGLRRDAEYYLDMYDRFLGKLTAFGIKVDDYNDEAERTEIVGRLRKLGVSVRNSEKSFVLGNISPSCLDCRTGEGSSTHILSLKCNRDCYFCANKNQLDYEELQTRKNDIIDQFNKSAAYFGVMKSVAITGGEPLLFPDECEKFIRYVKMADEKIQTRIYTNGDLADEKLMERLGKAGLDEARFGLKPDNNGAVEPNVIKNLKSAKSAIPRVMVEMPCKTGQLENMKALLDKLDDAGIFGVNILEYLFPWAHTEEYNREGYKIRYRPYRILFDYAYAGGAPVAGSEIECLKLMEYAAEKKYKMGVHYCSLENKLTSQIWLHNHKFRKTQLEHFSEKDFFVRTAKGYDNDAHRIKEILDSKKCKDYIYNKNERRIEFPMGKIPLLAGNNMQIGISVLVQDWQDGKSVVREVAIHLTDADSFSMNDI